MLLLCDSLPHVSHLSKCFQSAGCDYSIILRIVSSTVHAIKRLKTVDGVNMKRLQTFLEQVDRSGIEIKKPSHMADDYFNPLTGMVAEICHHRVPIFEKSLQPRSSSYALFKRISR